MAGQSQADHDNDARSTRRTRRLWGWRGAGLVAALTLAAAGCGSGHRTTTATPPSTVAGAPATTVPASAAGKGSTGASGSGASGSSASGSGAPASGGSGSGGSTNPGGPSFASVSGTYSGGTADGGSLYIRSDGASRFLGPDEDTCSSCTTADAPIASIDFDLKSISSSGSSHRASGTVTGTSDGPWAAGFSGGPATGKAVTVTIASGGHLTLSFLGANDVLTRTSSGATYTNTPPCTVAAVQAAYSQGTVVGVTCAQDKEWVAASTTEHGEDGVVVFQADFKDWVAVDRPTACNNNDVPSDLFQAACGSD